MVFTFLAQKPWQGGEAKGMAIAPQHIQCGMSWDREYMYLFHAFDSKNTKSKGHTSKIIPSMPPLSKDSDGAARDMQLPVTIDKSFVHLG